MSKKHMTYQDAREFFEESVWFPMHLEQRVIDCIWMEAWLQENASGIYQLMISDLEQEDG